MIFRRKLCLCFWLYLKSNPMQLLEHGSMKCIASSEAWIHGGHSKNSSYCRLTQVSNIQSVSQLGAHETITWTGWVGGPVFVWPIFVLLYSSPDVDTDHQVHLVPWFVLLTYPPCWCVVASWATALAICKDCWLILGGQTPPSTWWWWWWCLFATIPWPLGFSQSWSLTQPSSVAVCPVSPEKSKLGMSASCWCFQTAGADDLEKKGYQTKSSRKLLIRSHVLNSW